MSSYNAERVKECYDFGSNNGIILMMALSKLSKCDGVAWYTARGMLPHGNFIGRDAVIIAHGFINLLFNSFISYVP